MFFITNKNGNLIPRIFLKPSDVFSKITYQKTINFGKHTCDISSIRWLFNKFKDSSEIRCAICGCKASHFRIIKLNDKVWLRLYGFKKINGKTLYIPFNKDHIIPKKLNGTDSVKNIQCTCSHCNSIKGHSVPYDYFSKNLKSKKAEIHKMIYEFLDNGISKSTLSAKDATAKNAIKELINIHYSDIEKIIAKKLGYIL